MTNLLKLMKKYKNQVLYSIALLSLITLLGLLFAKPDVRNFFAFMEAKSFDLRQALTASSKSVNKDIVIVSIDDYSYEYLIDRYGDWPIPREVYADFLNYIESQKPSVVAFDLLFVKSLKSKPNSDSRLIAAINKYDNVYTAMSFDDQPFDLRQPPVLPDSLKVKITSDSKTFNPELIPNCRAILSGILKSTDRIGHINTRRSDDGINRKALLFLSYPEYHLTNNVYAYDKLDNYPYMTLKVAQKYLEQKENLKISDFKVDANNNLILGHRKIHMEKNSEVILNWYGPSGLNSNKTFTYVPFWKVLKSYDAYLKGEKGVLPDNFFNGKVVYVGTSVMSLSDIKSVPTEKYLPGVELHATLLNNIIDDCVIKKADAKINLLVTFLFALLVAFLVYRANTTFLALSAAVLSTIGYLFVSLYLMQFFHVWIWVVLPVVSVIIAFITVYLIKYIIKSRDLEYTYKLATTDGLTELYNHRFFQEQMLFNIEYARRTGDKFSLILIDIDFFKKFNDKFGHQAGDAVLKQVAQTLKKAVRGSDLVCRYGGEEMSIILRNTNKGEALIAAQKICDTVASKIFKLGPELEQHVTISLGVATYPQNGLTPSELIEFADRGLYAAKENGRNQVGKVE